MLYFPVGGQSLSTRMAESGTEARGGEFTSLAASLNGDEDEHEETSEVN